MFEGGIPASMGGKASNSPASIEKPEFPRSRNEEEDSENEEEYRRANDSLDQLQQPGSAPPPRPFDNPGGQNYLYPEDRQQVDRL